VCQYRPLAGYLSQPSQCVDHPPMAPLVFPHGPFRQTHIKLSQHRP
jgi:hypothetical protein